ncbi:Heparinase II/III-like protein [Clostridium cavendishii DSM 21758]|uniref:Heparinase II/III-like protein n=1 Tax=Clostridium cavendishii DSM 21758 TaxID=1121302 RepID=A0A1M6USD8_9CLOT|nr:alginate lyase family protein [Clostridium cavendishii]SHK72031.1 Heparinase II/III-like protein [Clostridium cavendishii DSM 21758]
MKNSNVFEIIDLDYKGLEKVRESYKNGDLDNAYKELRKYYFNRTSVKAFINDFEGLRTFVNRNLKEEFNEYIKIGDEVKEKSFLFQMKWEMERTHKRYDFEEEINWDMNPFGDEEWTYMLNRHRYLGVLAYDYLVTKDKKYGITFEELINHWIDNNPINDSKIKTSWRTIEAGIRLKNWVKALNIMLKTEYVTGELIAKILVSVQEHLIYLRDKHSESRILSNWVILEQHGAYIASVFFPELKISSEIEKFSLDVLEEALFYQVMPDGLHWEQSFQYHNEMLICFLDSILISNRNGKEISEKIYNKVLEMAYATLHIIKPDNTQSNYGDSDSEDLRELLTYSSLMFKDEYLKNKAYKQVDLYTLFNYGIEADKELDLISIDEIKQTSKYFGDNGLHFLRSGFNEKDSYSMFKCGYLGSGHEHCDMLHLDISARGEDILVDSGRYTYSEIDGQRFEFKQAKSHNTSTVDDLEFTICKGAWGNDGIATPIKRPYKYTEKYDFVEGGHLGYINIENPVLTNRKVIFIKPYIWLISDEFFGQGNHAYKQYFNFNSDSVSITEDNSLLYKGSNGDFLIKNTNEKGEFSLEESFVSKDYNHKYKSKRGIFKTSREGNTSINTVLISLEKNNTVKPTIKKLEVISSRNRSVKDEFAEAIEITVSEAESYIVLIVHKEDAIGRKLYHVDNIPMSGRVVVYRRGGEKTVLAY